MVLHAVVRRPRRTTQLIGRLTGGLIGRLAVLIASVSVFACGPLDSTASRASALSSLPSCAARPTSTPFTTWGDASSYFLMPDGGFESGGEGWTLTDGAAVTHGNETFFANATTDKHSLAMSNGAQAVSPTVCVAMGESTIRLFVKNPGVASSILHVQAYVQNPLTGLVLSTGYEINGTDDATDWTPTSPILIPNLLGGVLGTQRLTLVFTTSGAPASWAIDDIYVDPFRSY
jgi:hypothetical protein